MKISTWPWREIFKGQGRFTRLCPQAGIQKGFEITKSIVDRKSSPGYWGPPSLERCSGWCGTASQLARYSLSHEASWVWPARRTILSSTAPWLPRSSNAVEQRTSPLVASFLHQSAENSRSNETWTVGSKHARILVELNRTLQSEKFHDAQTFTWTYLNAAVANSLAMVESTFGWYLVYLPSFFIPVGPRMCGCYRRIKQA